MTDTADTMDEKTRRAIALREHRLHQVIRPVPEVVKQADPEGMIVIVFESLAGLWTLAAGTLVVVGMAGLAPRSLTDDRLTVHLAIALAAAAASALAAILYAIPKRIGAPLWSRTLPWLHALLLNAAFMLPAWTWHTTRLLHPGDWTGVLVTTVLLHLGWLVALSLNLAESLAPLMERPRTPLPDLLLRPDTTHSAGPGWSTVARPTAARPPVPASRAGA